MKYTVTFKVDGRFKTEVSADSADEAAVKANDDYYGANFGEVEVVEGEIISIEDETGEFVYEK